MNVNLKMVRDKILVKMEEEKKIEKEKKAKAKKHVDKNDELLEKAEVQLEASLRDIRAARKGNRSATQDRF